MKNQIVKVQFFVRKKTYNQSIENAIYGRISLSGEISEFSTQLYIPSAFQGSLKVYLREKGANVRKMEMELEKIRHSVLQTFYSIAESDSKVSAKRLKKAFFGEETEDKNMLLSLFEKHNKLYKSELSKATLAKYSTCMKHLRNFILQEYEKNDIDVREVDKKFVYLFEHYLRNMKCENNTTLKYLQRLKKIIRQAISFGYIKDDPFYNYKFKFEKNERECLSEDELLVLENKKIFFERIDKVRDIFVFCCYTGLAYADVKELKEEHLTNGQDGKIWINLKRQKTGIKTTVPLLPKAVDILKKYANDPYCVINKCLLPVLSNQKMNSYLKEIGDICGIRKTLSMHIARHTFATTVTLLNGVPIETVSKTLGHASLKTTMIYAKITDKKISLDMDVLFKKYSIS
jgi:site-specific recombinase XerD